MVMELREGKATIFQHNLIATEFSHFSLYPKQREQRQNNGSDCGAFVLADMVSFIKYGTPSNATQREMTAWRKEILTIIDSLPGLPEVRRNIGAEMAGEVIVIED
jgi:hypothetical protein